MTRPLRCRRRGFFVSPSGARIAGGGPHQPTTPPSHDHATPIQPGTHSRGCFRDSAELRAHQAALPTARRRRRRARVASRRRRRGSHDARLPSRQSPPGAGAGRSGGGGATALRHRPLTADPTPLPKSKRTLRRSCPPSRARARADAGRDHGRPLSRIHSSGARKVDQPRDRASAAKPEGRG